MSARRQLGHVRATVKAKKNGRFKVEVRTTTNAQGHEAVKSSTHDTRAEADAVVLAARKLAQRQHLTVAAGIEQHCHERKAEIARGADEDIRARKQASLDVTEQRLQRVFAPMLERPIRTITAEDALERYVQLAGKPGHVPENCSTGEPYKGASLVNLFYAARAFFDWAVLAGIWPPSNSNPFALVKVKVEVNRGGKQRLEEEARAILVASLRRRLAANPADEEAIHVAFLNTTGGRPSELLRRRPDQVVVRTITAMRKGCAEKRVVTCIRVPMGHAKNRDSAGYIPVPDWLGAPLLQLAARRKQGGEGFLMTSRTNQWSRRAVRRACKAVGLPYVVPYSFRSAMSEERVRGALAGGHPGQAALDEGRAALGHSPNSNTMERHYLPAEVLDEVEQVRITAHQEELDQVQHQVDLKQELQRLLQEGLLQDGTLGLAASRLAARLDAPLPPPAAAPASRPARRPN